MVKRKRKTLRAGRPSRAKPPTQKKIRRKYVVTNDQDDLEGLLCDQKRWDAIRKKRLPKCGIDQSIKRHEKKLKNLLRIKEEELTDREKTSIKSAKEQIQRLNNNKKVLNKCGIKAGVIILHNKLGLGRVNAVELDYDDKTFIAKVDFFDLLTYTGEENTPVYVKDCAPYTEMTKAIYE